MMHGPGHGSGPARAVTGEKKAPPSRKARPSSEAAPDKPEFSPSHAASYRVFPSPLNLKIRLIRVTTRPPAAAR
jgi:hypothetical protein